MDVVPVCSWCVIVDADRAVGAHVKLWVCVWIYTYVTVWGGEHDCLGTVIDDQWCQHSSQPIMWFSHSFSSSSRSSTKLIIYLRDCHICQYLSQASLVLNTIGFFTIIWKFARGKKFVGACQILHFLKFSTYWTLVDSVLQSFSYFKDEIGLTRFCKTIICHPY